MATLISKCCEDTGRAMNVIHTELEELKFQRSHESKVSLALHFAEGLSSAATKLVWSASNVAAN